MTTLEIDERHEESGDETEENDDDRFHSDVKKGNTLWNIAKGSDVRLRDLCDVTHHHHHKNLPLPLEMIAH